MTYSFKREKMSDEVKKLMELANKSFMSKREFKNFLKQKKKEKFRIIK